jgi:hypothetical protein
MYKIMKGQPAPKSEVLATFSAIITAMLLWCSNENILDRVFLRSLGDINKNIQKLFTGVSAA